MTRTEELLAEATAWYQAHTLDVVPIQYVDLQQLIELVRLQHEAITKCIEWGLHYGRHCEQPMKEAIEAFDKFEKGES